MTVSQFDFGGKRAGDCSVRAGFDAGAGVGVAAQVGVSGPDTAQKCLAAAVW